MPTRSSPTDPRATFGQNVREARQAAGLSQEALGLRTGVHPTEITRLETGRRNPGLLTIVRVAGGLAVPAADLLRGL